MKKIWIWNHYATDMYKNKGGRHFWFAENLIRNGYEPTIFCANTFHNSTDEIDTKFKKYTIKKMENIPFVFVKTKTALGNGLDRILNMLQFFFNLFPVTKKISDEFGIPDVIIASSVHPLTMVAGILIGKKLKVPVICEVRDLWPEAIFYFRPNLENSLIGKLLKMGEHWIYKKADALIFTKEGDVDYIIENKWNKENGGKIDLEKVFYINNGVDIKQFDCLSNSQVLQDNDLDITKFNVIYTGAIRPVNNVHNIVDAGKILKEYPNIDLLIYGEGNQKEELERKVKEENINNVKFKGFINKENIPYVLKQSSLNILNYSQEKYNWDRGNSSNKLFEYLASGVPVLSTVKMGYSIIKKYNCGIELTANTPEELAKGIIKLYNRRNSKEYNLMAENARNAAKDFDFEILTQRLINVIENV